MKTLEKTIEPLIGQMSLTKLWEYAINRNCSIAFWNLPHESKTKVLLNFTGKTAFQKFDFTNRKLGFVINAFNNRKLEEPNFIPAHAILTFHNNQLKLDYEHEDWKGKITEICDQKERIQHAFESKATTHHSISKSDYVDLVQSNIKRIEQGEIKKIVLAQRKEINRPNLFDPISKILELKARYPRHFSSLVYTPQYGTWIGSTPEVLLSVDTNKILTTISLAGTQKNIYKEPKEAVWTQKEIEEQALVSRYIINCFKKIRLREFEDIGPKTVISGNLLHLKTTFKVDLEEVQFPDLPNVLLPLLHPTSAVCGMPQQKATELLREENFDRELYSGYLGPVHIDDETHLFVNLRCAKIEADKIVLFAGAGITEDSVPEKEWEETELKCKVISDVITKQS